MSENFCDLLLLTSLNLQRSLGDFIENRGNRKFGLSISQKGLPLKFSKIVKSKNPNDFLKKLYI